VSFIHQFLPATNPEEQRTLLLLHGTGGDEQDLIPLGQTLLPGAAILSPRGHISEGGMSRFFRRFGEGVFDLENLKEEAAALAEFVRQSASQYGFDPNKVVGVGFSNGANMAHSLLLLHPETLKDVVAIRAMTTFPDAKAEGLQDKRVFISSGRFDPIVPTTDAENLARQLREGGADVTHHWVETGHNLTREEVVEIAAWLSPKS
jgi:phospholipase/carboxylesterase